MAPRYNLSNDLLGEDGLQSTSPMWVVGFARFANPVTWDPASRSATSSSLSFAKEEKKPILVTTDCISAQVNVSKGSHRMSMSLEFLEGGDIKFLNEVLPGDWVVANVAYNETDAETLAAKMKGGKRVNGWNDGLKFLGRVRVVTKAVVISGDGKPTSRYRVQCEAFSELDSVVMYYPQLQRGESIPESMAKFGVEIGKVVRGQYTNEQGAININDIIPRLLAVIFGEGAWAGQKFRGEVALTPNSAYVVPTTVFSWLGQNEAHRTFADLLRVMLGVQKYSRAQSASNSSADPGKLFWPDDSDISQGTFGKKNLIGDFPANVVPQTTSTAWSFLTTYLNPPINEVLVTLRPSEDGFVFPFFTVRQTPYTSERGLSFDENASTFQLASLTEPTMDPVKYRDPPNLSRGLTLKGQAVPVGYTPPSATAKKDVFQTLPTTRFLELPRWVVPTSLLRNATISRTDDNRFNLVFVAGTGPGVMFDEANQFVLAGPITDKLDIARNGIRPYMPSVNVFMRDFKKSLMVQDFRDLMADIVMGQHLTLNGSMTVSGIRSPVSPGDNLEFEGVVYHIESVTHTYSYDPASGNRDFNTTFSLSRGILDRLAIAREDMFANLNATDPEGSAVGVNKD